MIPVEGVVLVEGAGSVESSVPVSPDSVSSTADGVVVVVGAAVAASQTSSTGSQVPTAGVHSASDVTPGTGAASARPGAITARPTQPASTTAALRLLRRPLIFAPHRVLAAESLRPSRRVVARRVSVVTDSR